jgi:cyclase
MLDMNKRLAAIAMLGAAFLGAQVHGLQFGQDPARLDLIKVTDDLYVIHNPISPGNTTVVLTGDGVILIDDKFEIDHAGLMAELKKITTQPIRYVINTHHHPDHTGGNPKLQALGAQVVSSIRTRERMMEANADPSRPTSGAEPPGLPNMAFEERATMHVGGKTLELYYMGRGHTDGDIVVYFPNQRILASGDLFTFGDETPQLIDYSGGGSAKEWPKTLDRVLALDFDTVIPGHGVVTTKAEMRKFRDRASLLKDRVHEMLLQKKTPEQISTMLVEEFHWVPFLLDNGLYGLLGEMR